VISTLPTPDVVTTVSRAVGLFPPEEQEIARQRLAEALHSVIAQRLLPRADGQGRIAAVEILICTEAVRDLIKDANRTSDIPDHMREAREEHGMQTFDQHLLDLVAEGAVSYETALAAASYPAEFEREGRKLRRVARLATPAQVAKPGVADPAAGLTDDLSGLLPDQ